LGVTTGTQQALIETLVALCMLIALSTGRAATVFAPSSFGPINASGIPASMDGIPLASTGTGFYVSKAGDFVTAYHVAGFCHRRAIIRPDGAHEAFVVAMNAKADVSVLRSSSAAAAADLALGVGLGKGARFEITRTANLGGLESRSVIAAHGLAHVRVPDRPEISFAVTTDVPVVGGNSGSPLTTETGAVAGLVDAIAKADPRLSLIIDADVIASVLTSAGVPFRWQGNDGSGTPVSPQLALRFTFPVACYVEN
jgi:S1-C subfamily serine protease